MSEVDSKGHDLRGRVVICTGASSGIGRHASLVLARYGARVFLTGRRKEKLHEVNAKIAEDGNNDCISYPADLLNKSVVSEIVDKCVQKLGSPDILVNAAGVNFRENWNDISFDSWDKTIQLNLSAPFFIAQKAIQKMKKKEWGRIINIASLQSYRAFPNGLAYGASKGGIAQVTRGMAEAWSRYGITANAIAPGFFPTELTAPVFDDLEKTNHNAAMTAIGRNGRLEDLDGVILFLASKVSDYVTGQIINVDGGYSAK